MVEGEWSVCVSAWCDRFADGRSDFQLQITDRLN